MSKKRQCFIWHFVKNTFTMINFDYLESNKEELRLKYLFNDSFSYLYIDNFCDDEKTITIDRFYNDGGSSNKKFITKQCNKPVNIKHKFFGSGTSKNQ